MSSLTISDPSSQISIPVTNLQQDVADKLTKTTIKVTRDFLLLMISSHKMDAKTFVDTHVTPKQAPLSQIDERTSKFFQKMMQAVNEQIDQFPSYLESFVKLQQATEDADIRKKLLEGIAFPSVKELITDLDGIKPSIIDDIIEA
jgi:translation initiation factor 2B subunit (eIF-2B alpha/beta/delta family)